MKIAAALASANAVQLSIEEIDLSSPVAGEVVVRIVASGLCHTDLTLLDHVPLQWPAVLGHEGAGIVEAIGMGVSGVVPGDHVVMTTASCGTCHQCLGDSPAFCSNFVTLNMSGGKRGDGSCTHSKHGKPVFGRFLGQSSFASHAVVGERSLVKVDRVLPLDMLAPFGCGIQTGAGAVLNTLQVRAASSVGIFGTGAVGLSALMAAKLAGATRIIAVDTKPERLEVARELGATETILASKVDAVAHILAIGGVDYAVEASGFAAVMEQAVACLAIGGTAVLVGVASGAKVAFDPMTLQSKGQTIKGSLMGGPNAVPSTFIPKLIAFWRAGLLPVEKLITFYDFDDINSAIGDARSGSTIKPVLRMPRPEGE